MKMNVIWITLCCVLTHFPVAIAGTVESIQIRDSKLAMKGADIQLVCEISRFSSQDVVSIFKTDSRVLSGSLPTLLNQCIPSLCLTTAAGRYTFSADNSHVYINITDLNRSEDEKYWTCLIYPQRKDFKLKVYTVPQTLQFDNSPSQDQDLALNAVIFRCRTGCSYPQPNITWFYYKSGGTGQEWTASGPFSKQTGTCNDLELIYTSALSLARFTTFPGNIETTVQFTCGITSFPGLTQPLYTSQSVNVQFAVQVTSVILNDGNNVPPEPLQVTSGVPYTLTCTPSVSRPTATVVWYIGTEEKQRSSSSTSFTFTPQNRDHNKQVYCKGFNIQAENIAVTSEKTTLYVQVQVTNVTLKDDNRIPSEPLRVTSGVFKTLTCTTSGNRPTPTVVWYIGPIEIYRSSFNTSFTFTPFNSHHNKQIFCQAFNIQPESQAASSNKVKLYVRVQVSSVTLTDGTNPLSKEFLVTGGIPTTFTCTTSISRPVATVVWYIGTDEKQRLDTSATLTFTPQSSDQNKQIFCKAFNIQPESEAVSSTKATLHVRDPSTVQSFYIEGSFGHQYVTVDEHDGNIQFKCIVHNYNPAAIELKFSHDLLKKETSDSSLSFILNDVTCFDAGVYVCEGDYGNEQRSKSNVTLLVNCSPRPLRQKHVNVTSNLHVPVTLNFTAVAYPYPGPKGFTWYKEQDGRWLPLLANADLKISSSNLQSNLTLLNVSKTDYGQYQVSVTNNIGSYQQFLILSEETKETGHQQEINSHKSDSTTFVVGISTLGVVCCVLVVYAIYLTLLQKRMIHIGRSSSDRPSKQTMLATPSFVSGSTGRGENEQTDKEEATVQQYTDLSQYANADKNTYDVIKRT